MGTAGFAVPTLEALAAAGHRILAVYTQPDRPSGRGLKVSMPPVKHAALGLGLQVLQPAGLTDGGALKRLEIIRPELAAVVAYGLKLPPSFLAAPRLGCVNLHPSLLPRYRGAAPVNRAIMNGESETGVTVIRMNDRMDAGDIVLQEAVEIGPEEDAGRLEDRLSRLGAEMMVKAAEVMGSGSARLVPQDEPLATRAPKLGPDDGRIDWTRRSRDIVNQVRGLTPRPGAFALFRGRRLGITKARAADDIRSWDSAVGPGRIAGTDTERGPAIRTGDGAVFLAGVKPAGKREMGGAEFIRGYRLERGEELA